MHHETSASRCRQANSLAAHPVLAQLTALSSLDLVVQSPTAAVLAGLGPKARAANAALQRQHEALARVLKRLTLFTLNRHAPSTDVEWLPSSPSWELRPIKG